MSDKNKQFKIPKIIHQIWWQGENNIPTDYPIFSLSWKKLNPDYQYILWDEQKINNILYEYFPWFADTFNRLPKMIQKIDAAKYFILYHYGGIYADMDSECVKNIDDLIIGKELILPKLEENPFVKLFFYGRVDDTLQNNFLASIPNHPFWIHCLKLITNEKLEQQSYELYEKWIFRTTGPGLVTNAYYTFPNNHNISLVGRDLVDPISVCEHIDNNCAINDCKKLYPNVYTIHHYGSNNKKYGWLSGFGKDNVLPLCTYRKYIMCCVCFCVIILILFLFYYFTGRRMY